MKILQKARNQVFQFSPVGGADKELREKLDGKNIDWKDYEKSLKNYRVSVGLFNVTRVFFYAGLINSVASTFNIWGAGILQQIASYIGVTFIFVLYTMTRYFSTRRRELYRLEREFLINQSS